MKYFRASFVITLMGLGIAVWWGGWQGMMIAAILAVMEVSLSFDNAVVNAGVLKTMDAKWQHRFLTWGMVIAVFGMRLVFPVAIVALATGLNPWDVTLMAFRDQETYAKHLIASHIQIAAFGGMFLLMVFLSFFFDTEKEVHWINWLEERLSALGKLASVEIVVALGLLLMVVQAVEPVHRLEALTAGVIGVVLFVLVDSVAALFDDSGEAGKVVQRSGLMSFIYLELLDASFSLDGVVGAFAITKDVVIIMTGLMIGAMFVRSLTIFLVHKETLDEYIFLEHGAHYAIGALAALMLTSMVVHVPEAITGLIGFALIVLSLWSSVRHRQQHAA